MTTKEFELLEQGDIVKVVDWEYFTNERMRKFIGGKFAIDQTPDENDGYATLCDQDNITIYGNWGYRDLELVSKSSSQVETDITMLF